MAIKVRIVSGNSAILRRAREIFNFGLLVDAKKVILLLVEDFDHEDGSFWFPGNYHSIQDKKI